jgi:hypothetical protein
MMSLPASVCASAAFLLLVCACASNEPVTSDRDGGRVTLAGDARVEDGELASSDADVHRPDAARADAGVRAPVSAEPLDPDDPLLGGNPPASPDGGCGKIDFLFVIDNSGSMEDEQQNLIKSFPGFLDTIRSSVAASDHHVLVTDTDASGAMGSQSSSCSGNVCTCTPVGSCCEAICASRPGGTCNGTSCGNPGMAPRCDGLLGAGRVKDIDANRCIPDSPRFLSSDTADLETKFSCMARVGIGGDGNERPMQAISEAVGGLSEPGQCNAGFLRDDAILVVTFITDEEDAAGKSPGAPRDWMAKLIAAKHGKEEAVVVLGVFGDSDRAGSTCAPGGLRGNLGADPGPRLRAFVDGFKYGVAGSVCAPDYAPFFAEAVKVIDVACDEFTQ